MSNERTGASPIRCQLCAGDPRWRFERVGDAIVTWTCEKHVALILIDLLPIDKHHDQVLVTDLDNAWRPPRD